MKDINKFKAELKKLKTNLKEVEEDILERTNSIKLANKHLIVIQKRRAQLHEKIAEMSKELKGLDRDIEITDHATSRYLSRVLGVDIEELKKSMLNEELKLAIRQLGGSGAINVGGHSYKFKDYKITTVI
jgi:chromosome segregation ATPase